MFYRKMKSKRFLSLLLSLVMIITILPVGIVDVKADVSNEVYNLAVGRVVYSSSENGNETADKAVDEDDATRWQAASNDKNEWLYVDLGKVADIDHLYIHWEAAYAKSYQIQFSNDEENWKTVYTKGKDASGSTEPTGMSISYNVESITNGTGIIYASWTPVDNAKYKVCVDNENTVATAPDNYKFNGHPDANGRIKLSEGKHKLIVIVLDKTTGREIGRGESDIEVKAGAGGSQGGQNEEDITKQTITFDDLTAAEKKARYVKIICTERQQDAYGCSFYEFQVYGLNGANPRPADYGTNLALNKATQNSGVLDEWWMKDDKGNLKPEEVAKVDGRNAVDGNNTTCYKSKKADNQWLYVDLGKDYNIGRIILNWASGAGKIYDIQVSKDAENWTTIYRQMKGYPQLKENLVIYSEGVRYIRIYGYTRVSSDGSFELNELQVYEYRSGDAKTTYEIKDLPEQKVVTKGAGSYVTNNIELQKAKLPVYVDASKVTVPIASNDWWQSALINKFGNLMSLLPLKAKYSTKGLNILTATSGWVPDLASDAYLISSKSETKADIYVAPENYETSSAYDRVSGYGDYHVTLDLCDDNGVQMQSTFVKGSPYIFSEFGKNTIVYISASKFRSIFNDSGNEILNDSKEITADHIGIQITDNDNKAGTDISNSYYCITVPEGTKFKKAGSKITVTFPSANGYMSVGSMNAKSDLNSYYKHGYAFVTDTKVTYTYGSDNQNIISKYTVTTKSKRSGFSSETMQCMLPHQWKKSTDDSKKVALYTSVRGNLHGIFANEFATNAKFAGLLPTFAVPNNNNFDGAVVVEYLKALQKAKGNISPAADAYWQGKDLHPLGMGVLMADQLGETAMRDDFLSKIKKILVNWFHYDGAGDNSYFIYDDNWGTIYYNESGFGANTGIADHHFTYGYFMFAATVLATYDSEFYNQYKDMIEMLIRDYANPSETDREFCRFRSYDLYEGHSWAGGYADNDDGNNQESASESLFSWASLYLWGVLTGDKKYLDAGVFGFSNEMEAVEQYWFDYDKDNWLKDYPYEVVGQVYGGTNFYGTFFGGQPVLIYGIQWCPVSEYLTYYGMNPERCAEIYQGLWDETEIARNIEKDKGNMQAYNDYWTADNYWQHITWPFLAYSDSALALEKVKANIGKISDDDKANTYWFVQAVNQLGTKTTDIIAIGNVSAAIYKKGNTYTANVWNPTTTSQMVTFKDRSSGKVLGTATVGSKSLLGFEVSKNGGFNYAQVATPTFKVTSLNDGVVKNDVSGEIQCDDTQIVEIENADEDATVYYTIDGSTPTTDSPKYTGKIVVSSTSTVKAIAVKKGAIDSAYASLTVNVNGSAVSYNENIAKGKTVTTSSNENGGTTGANIVDGNLTTRWSSGSTDNQWCVIDLGKEYTINSAKLNWEAAYATEYMIQVSMDNKNWTTVSTVTNGTAGERTVIFDAISARYVKMQGVRRATQYGYSIYEMEVYEAVKASKPTIDISGDRYEGTYIGAAKVKMSTDIKGAEIKYTLDGSTPTEKSATYTGEFDVNKNSTIKAVTYRKGMLVSDVTTSAAIKVIDKIDLSETNMFIAVGSTKRLTAKPSTGIRWSSTDSSVVTVDSNGNVNGVKNGEAVIIVKSANAMGICRVTVKEATKLESITFEKTSYTLKPNVSETLVVQYNPFDTTDDRTLIWSSSDASVVSVSNGVITTYKEGTATITAMCGAFSATCQITVTNHSGGNIDVPETTTKNEEPSANHTDKTSNSQQQVTTTKKQRNAKIIKKPAKTKIKSIKKKKSLKILVILKRVKKVQGYQIEYSTNKRFKKSKKITKRITKKKTKILSKKLAKKKYYVRARTYIIVNKKKVYSKWSAKKRVSMK